VRPWEEPGAVRRDCAMHRGPLLGLLATLSVIVGCLAAGLLWPAIVSIPFALVVWAMARRDLALMDAGLMDPQGRKATQEARNTALGAALLPLLGVLIWALLMVALTLVTEWIRTL
jgi:hypothetical protein